MSVTLVVGRRNSEGVIHVAGDMRLTDPAEIRRGFPYAVLKNIILSEDHLVAYAGNADLGMHTIRELKDAPLAKLQSGLFASAKEAGDGRGSVDYLVAHTRQGLQRITAKGIEEPADAGWIGDPAAYEVYQRGYHNAQVPEPTWIEGVSPPREELGDPAAFEPFTRMFMGTHELMEDGSVATVGEVFVTANSKRGFHYAQQGAFYASHEQEIGPEWTTINWGRPLKVALASTCFPLKNTVSGPLGSFFPTEASGFSTTRLSMTTRWFTEA